MGMIKEFKEFINKGNVLDMAVGIVLGAAFGAVINSFVADIVSPVLGLILGGTDFSAMGLVLKEAVMNGEEVVKEAVVLGYGKLINAIITFLLTAFALFLVVKAYNNMKRKEEEKPATPPAPSKEEVLLGEIRDLLKK